jgi:hypothetical protein
MGTEIVGAARSYGHPVLWLAHRVELVDQARERLAAAGLGGVTVSTVQTLHARGARPRASLLIVDECHHYKAKTYQHVLQAYPTQAIVGLTATPERSDGKPLGDIFDALVVAANYSELVGGGQLVPCRVFRPSEALDTGLGQDPVQAYQTYTPGERAFCFAPSISLAEQWSQDFTAAGISAASITEKTPTAIRAERVKSFRSGRLTVLTNVYTLTEGIDVPEATTAILARGCSHVTPYLQMVGRVLRAAPGKPYATLLDLPGVSYQHGLPTENRKYSLGDGVSRDPGPGALAVCQKCGWTYQGSSPKCPKCGYVRPIRAKTRIRIWNRELREVYDHEHPENTPEYAKDGEFYRLLAIAQDRGYSLYWVTKQYKTLFGQYPSQFSGCDVTTKRAEYDRLLGTARQKGWKDGWAAARYKQMFGAWPQREWRA